MNDTVNAAETETRVREWYRDERNGVSRDETGLVASFCVVMLRDQKLLSTIAVASMWRLAVAPDRVVSTLPTESQHATFERMASAVFPADFAAEATRLVRNEPNRASDPVMERIAAALECLALNTVMMNKGFATDKAFGDIAVRAIGRVQANVEGRK